MARNKIGLQLSGLDEYMARLDEIGGSKAMIRATEAALKASKQYVNPLIESAMATSNLPASGQYSTGDTKSSIDKDMSVEWEGMTASINVGFKFKESGPKSIFLMYGTPRTPPVKGLKAAIYGNKTKKQLSKVQSDTINKVISRIMEDD